MEVASLFAGIGGFDLAAGHLGMSVALQAESDQTAQRVLRAHWPDAELVDDATKVDLRGIDLVTAGFPCQGLSAAASTRKKSGLLDPESASYPIWAALERIFEARPEYLLLENSSSLDTARYSADMGALIRRLEEAGYFPHAVTLNSGCYQSNMRRTRTFVLARRRMWLAPDVRGTLSYECDRGLAIGVNNQHGGASWCVQPSITKKAKSYSLMVTPYEVRSLLPEAVEDLFGFPSGHTAPAGSASTRYERLGNAVSVGAARAALQLLLNGYAMTVEEPAPYCRLYDRTAPARGGTAGSGVSRIVRSQSRSGANTNRIELDYALPVYLKWMQQHPETVTEAMWAAARQAERMGLAKGAREWPKMQTVTMSQ